MSNKFLDFLGKPQKFSHGAWLVAKEAMTKEEFCAFLNEDITEGATSLESITTDWVHFHLGYDEDGDKVNQWWTGCGHIKGAKEVWSSF